MTAPVFERGSQRYLAGTFNKESVYGTTPVVDGDLTYLFRMFSKIDHSATPKFLDNKALYGKGVEFATNQQLELWESKLSMDGHLTSQLAGMLLAFGFGTDTPTSPESGVYSHAHALASDAGSVSLQLPSTGFLARDTSGIKWKYNGMCLDNFKIGSKRGERLTVSANWIGSGERTTSTVAKPTSPADPLNYLRWSGCKIEYGVSGVLVDVSARVVSCDIEWKNNLDAANGHVNNGGVYATRMLFGTRELVVSNFVIEVPAAATYWTDLSSNVKNKLVLTATGETVGLVSNHKMTITIPGMYPKTRVVGNNNGLVTIALDDSCFYDTVTSEVVDAVVVNDVAAYLTASA